ncbi:hypothetical protein NHX12_027747 [Muraenolepis orangiensis]|uniref:Uncharacterized protein n=1 Tax=Muraenolepis orangiensis TaxID=630683 RepID=A0A9Q0EHI5_9TELE|nr:hypothetical protein NHX12_027747 [Muraenolepis orangiensis]
MSYLPPPVAVPGVSAVCYGQRHWAGDVQARWTVRHLRAQEDLVALFWRGVEGENGERMEDEEGAGKTRRTHLKKLKHKGGLKNVRTRTWPVRVDGCPAKSRCPDPGPTDRLAGAEAALGQGPGRGSEPKRPAAIDGTTISHTAGVL